MINTGKLVQRLLQTFLLLFFGTVAVIPGWIIYWANEDSPIIYGQRKILNPIMAPQGNPIVRRGGTLVVSIAAEVSKDCRGIVYRSIIDSAGQIFYFAPEERPTDDSYEVPLPISTDAKLGPARYQAHIEWQCNFIQKYFPKVRYQSPLAFEIVREDTVIQPKPFH